MIPIRHLFMPLLLICAGLSSRAELRQLDTRNLLHEDGLLTTTVNDLAQDSHGFLWIATPYGLYRHDGVSVWKYFDNGDSAGISSNLIRRVDADNLRETVWIGTYYSGLCVFDCKTETFSRLNHAGMNDGSLSNDNINDIFVDSDHRVWIATDKGVDMYDYDTGRFRNYNHLTVKGFPAGRVNRVRACGDTVWIGHASHGVSRLDLATGALKSYSKAATSKALASDEVLSLCADTTDRIWIGTNAGVSLLDTKSGLITDLSRIKGVETSFCTQIYDVARTGDGYMWFATGSDVCYFCESDLGEIVKGEKDVLHTYIRDYEWGIANPSVLALLEDGYGNLWAGSNGGGASFFERGGRLFSAWRIDKVAGVTNGLNDKEVLSICLSADEGTVLMGTDGGGVNVNVGGINGLFFTPGNSNLKSSSYHNVLRAGTDTFLLSSYHGLEMFDLASGRSSLISVPRHDYPLSMIVDASGQMWIGYMGGGIEVRGIEGTAKASYSASNTLLPRSSVTALFQDADGNVWIGTFGFGLYLYEAASGEIVRPEVFDRPCTVNHIISDRGGNLWIATDVGLVSVSSADARTRVYSEADGMECASVFSLVEDGMGNIWMSTNVGISCYVRDEDKFRNFGVNDGVLPGPYLRHSCARKSDGTILMGGMNGVCFFNEADFRGVEDVPVPRFTSFSVLGREYSQSAIRMPVSDGTVVLSSEENTFSVTFSPMNRAVVDRSLYAYRMVGLSNDWIDIDHESKISFHNLPAGNYDLQVKARLANQQWPEGCSSLRVVIKSSPWLSPWAKAAYLLLALGAAWGAVAFRRHLAGLHKRNHEMEAEVTKSKTMRQALIDSSLSESDREFVETLIRAVEERLDDERLDVETIARQMGLSYSSLYRRVKSVTGGTVSDFVKRVRVHQAEKLLLAGRHSVSEIARMVGLSSVSYFRECFKREFGMSPTQWIKQIKEASPR